MEQRRSAQTAMYLMADGLTRLLAPILSFTADELWRYLPGTREESVHIAVFPTRPELETLRDAGLVDRWSRLVSVREQVLAEIEPLRKSKQIGSSLQAKVVISATTAELALLEPHAKLLPMLFIVSEVELRPAPADVDYVAFHQARVCVLALRIGSGLGYDRGRLASLGQAAALFDVALWQLPETILRRGDSLAGEELVQWRAHPRLSADIISGREVANRRVASSSGCRSSSS